jgi:large subunit ribosomal protein L23
MIEKFKTTEKSVRLIEAENTLIIEVGRKNSKEEIKKEIEKSFNVKVDKVRTHIKDNKKFAYVKLNSKNPAIDIATKFGLI